MGHAGELLEAVTEAGRAAGLARVGVATVEPLDAARRAIEDRLAAGYDAGMQFTFRNPARSTDPRSALPSAARAVVGALPYPVDPDVVPPDAPAGRVAWYATEDHYATLGSALEAMGEVLRAAGHRAVAVADSNALVDRAIAERAGIGWFGKNANLLAPGLGSWFVLGAVLTDAELPAAAEPVADGCGSCARCLPACPTGAIVAPGVVDGRRCLAWLVQADGDLEPWAREALGDRLYGCDDCQEVCPPSRRAADARSATGRHVDLVELLASTDEELLDRHGRWYLPRRDPSVLRRNALVALGNTADGAGPAVAAALRAHLGHPDPMVRRHAVWAARRVDRDDLLAGMADDPDAGVRRELVAGAP